MTESPFKYVLCASNVMLLRHPGKGTFSKVGVFNLKSIFHCNRVIQYTGEIHFSAGSYLLTALQRMPRLIISRASGTCMSAAT